MAEPLNATFFAFRKREKGGALLGTSIAYVIIAAVLIGAFIAINLQSLSGAMSAYMSLIQQSVQSPKATPDYTGFLTSFSSLAGSYFVFLFLVFLLLASYEAACLRWMIRGERGGFLGLTLGADTWRVWLGYWVWLVLAIGFYLLFVAIIAATTIGGFAAIGASKGGATAPIAGLAMFGGFLLAFAVVIYLAVRLAPGAAASIISRKFAMFDAWRATRGRFWALFGAFFLVYLIYILVVLIMEIVFGAVMGVAAISAMSGKSDPSTVLAGLMSPGTMITMGALYLGVIVIAMVFYVALFGVNARAVLAAAEEGKLPGVAPPQAEVFS